MKTMGLRLGLLLGAVLAMLLVNPVASNAATRLSGGAYSDAVQCSGPPAGYEDFTSYPGLVMTGSLEGCLYTKVISSKETPGGVYLESGEEVFFGSLDNGPEGTFATTYKFESRFDPDSGVQQHGRCQHPIVEGSGTGGFAGAKGRLDFKDIIGDDRHHLRLPRSYQPQVKNASLQWQHRYVTCGRHDAARRGDIRHAAMVLETRIAFSSTGRDVARTLVVCAPDVRTSRARSTSRSELIGIVSGGLSIAGGLPH